MTSIGTAWQPPLRQTTGRTHSVLLPAQPLPLHSGGLWCQPGKRPSPKVNPQRIEPFPVRTLLPGGVLGARHAPPLGTDHCSAFPKHCGCFFSPSPQRCTKRPQRRSALCGQSRESPELRAVSGSVFGVPRQSVSGEGGRRCRGCLTAVLGVPEGDAGVPEGGARVPEGNARGPRSPVPLPRESRRGLALQHHPAPPGGAARGWGGGGRVTRPAQLLLAGPGRIAGGARSLAEGEHCGRSHWLEGGEGGARVSLNGVAEGGARHSPSRGSSGSEAEPPAAERRRDMLAA